jgi:hypothetical protein
LVVIELQIVYNQQLNCSSKHGATQENIPELPRPTFSTKIFFFKYKRLHRFTMRLFCPHYELHIDGFSKMGR